MAKFEIEETIPSCLVTKDLLGGIEHYLNVAMPQKLGATIGNKFQHRISIKEKIGSETLSTISEYLPSRFPNSTKEISIRWNNGLEADSRIEIGIGFDGSLIAISELRIDCTGATARETAIAVRDGLMRNLEPCQTYNWIFNPFALPIVPLLAGCFSFPVLSAGGALLPTNQASGIFLICGGAFLLWFALSGFFFRRRILFDTRREQLLDRTWRYISLGSLGFVLFGTIFPIIRKALVGF